MATSFSQSFKLQAVENALNRQDDIQLKDFAKSLGIGYSTLQKWIRQSKNQQLDPALDGKVSAMTKEKRPQDWTAEERLNVVIACGPLTDDAINQLCREKGIYPHHIKQWKNDFIKSNTTADKPKKQSDDKQFKNEIKALQKELNRKNKALAETAALLVLQKKVNAIWGNSEDSSL